MPNFPINLELLSRIAVPLGTLMLGKYLDQWLAKRPKLISYLFHASAFSIRGSTPYTVHTHAIVIRNTGRVAASNVRVGHLVFPEHYQLFPPILHDLVKTSEGGGEIVIPKLVPGEQVTISYLYFPPLLYTQIHSYTKSDEGFAKVLTVLPTPQFPKWATRSLWILVFIGASSVIYALVELILRVF